MIKVLNIHSTRNYLNKNLFYLLTAYQILHLEVKGRFHIFGTDMLFKAVLIFDKDTADGDLSDSSSAVFFVYSGVNFEKYYWEKTCFFRHSELQYSKIERIICFL